MSGHASSSVSPDGALLAALARRFAVAPGVAAVPPDLSSLPDVTPDCRKIALHILGAAAVKDPAVAANLLDVERSRPEAFARAARLVADVHTADPPEPVLAACARHLAPAASPPCAEAVACLAAPLLRASRLVFGQVRRALAAFEDRSPDGLAGL